MTTIAVLGDVMLDSYTGGRCHRLSPEAPVPVISVNVTEQKHVPGGAANVAHQIVKLHNGSVHLFGVVGVGRSPAELSMEAWLTDEGKQNVHNFVTNKELEAQLDAYNITFHKIELENHISTQKERYYIQHGTTQQVLRADREIKCENTQVDLIIEKLEQDKPSFLLLSDYIKGFFNKEIVDAVLQWAAANDVFVAVDTKAANLPLYISETGASASLIKPNLKEFCEMMDLSYADFVELAMEQQEQMLEEKGLPLAKKYNTIRIVTRASDGATVLIPDGQTMHIPTSSVDVADVSGAGDTFMGTVLVALSKGMSIEDAVMWGNRAGSIAVGKRGTYAVSREELGRE